MRRREFLTGAAAGAAVISLGPAGRASGAWPLATTLPAAHPARRAVQAALPLRADARGAARLAAAAEYTADRPALAILADLPFGPPPEQLVPWLLSADGADLWRRAAGPGLLPVWASPGSAPRFIGSELFVLHLAGLPDANWIAGARRALAGATGHAASHPTATEAHINAGNRAADRVARLAASGDPLTRCCLAEMRKLALSCAAAACHHPLMALAG